LSGEPSTQDSVARMDVPMYHNTPKQFISAALGAHVTQEGLFFIVLLQVAMLARY